MRRVIRWLTFADVRDDIRAAREDMAATNAQLDLLMRAMEHPGETVYLQEGAPHRTGEMLSCRWNLPLKANSESH
jgi:hypothetical protein